MSIKNICYFFIFLLGSTCSGYAADRIPFYEDYLQESDLNGFLEEAANFLANSPESPLAPRIAMDYLMAGKAANLPEVVDKATDLLLFKYPQSLPSLQFISSFDSGSPRLSGLLVKKANQGDLGSKEFAVTYCKTLLLIARMKGPELFKDVPLRLRAYLLATLAEVEEIEKTAQISLQELAEKSAPIGQILKIIFSDQGTQEKIHSLSQVSGGDAKFCLSFYLSQLTPEEVNSEKMIIYQIKNDLFGNSPDTSKVRELISNLPPKTIASPSMIAFSAFSHHLDQEQTKAIQILENGAKNTPDPAWQESLQSYAGGITFMEDRMSALLGALGTAVDELSQDADCLAITTEWDSSAEDGRKVQNQILLGLSKAEQKIEIQYRKNNQLYMGYKSSESSSSILSPDSDQIYHFLSQGALPMPGVAINRDVVTGAFSYNFKLNFGSSFAKFLENGSSFLENPYIATTKGREVLWNHILGSKLIWLEATQSSEGGTTFPIRSISKEDSKVKLSSLTFDLEGNLKSTKIGKFSISSIQRGDASILTSLPAWPKLETIEEKEFDFSMFMQMVGSFGAIAQN
jgi:hypothetical protein